MAKVRVRIVAHLDVDIEDWAAEFGVKPTRSAVSADVKAYFAPFRLVPDHLAEIVEVVS